MRGIRLALERRHVVRGCLLTHTLDGMRTKLALEVTAGLLLGRDIEAIVVVNRQIRLGCSRRNIKGGRRRNDRRCRHGGTGRRSCCSCRRRNRRRHMRKVRRNKTRRGGRSTTSSPLVAWRRMKVTPCSIDTLNTREGVLVEYHLARHDESAGGRHVDARTRGRLRRPQADTESTTVGEVPVAIPASKRHKDTNKAAKGPEVCHGGRGASEDEIGREVATRRLRQTVQPFAAWARGVIY